MLSTDELNKEKKRVIFVKDMSNLILDLIDVNPETDKLNLQIEDTILIVKKAE